MAASGLHPDVVRWELSLVDLFRFRHAQLWLDGHRCRRITRQGAGSAASRRARFDTLAAKYHGCRH